MATGSAARRSSPSTRFPDRVQFSCPGCAAGCPAPPRCPDRVIRPRVADMPHPVRRCLLSQPRTIPPPRSSPCRVGSRKPGGTSTSKRGANRPYRRRDCRTDAHRLPRENGSRQHRCLRPKAGPGAAAASDRVTGERRTTGRAERIRTSDPLLPKQVRYQAAPLPDRGGALRAPPGRGKALFPCRPCPTGRHGGGGGIPHQGSDLRADHRETAARPTRAQDGYRSRAPEPDAEPAGKDRGGSRCGRSGPPARSWGAASSARCGFGDPCPGIRPGCRLDATITRPPSGGASRGPPRTTWARCAAPCPSRHGSACAARAWCASRRDPRGRRCRDPRR